MVLGTFRLEAGPEKRQPKALKTKLTQGGGGMAGEGQHIYSTLASYGDTIWTSHLCIIIITSSHSCIAPSHYYIIASSHHHIIASSYHHNITTTHQHIITS
jgi:hypothetical protein